MNLNNKKSQITIFIILAIVILFVSSLALVVKNKISETKPPVPPENLPTDVQTIHKHVTLCMYEIAQEGIVKLGKQGGYIDVSGLIISPLPYDSEALNFPPNNIAYWNYLTDCPQSAIGCLDSKQPPLCKEKEPCIVESNGKNSIQEQLENYVEDNLGKCIDFKNFEDSFSIEEGEKDADITISLNDVELLLEYPLEITQIATGEKTEIESFHTKLDVKLGKMYKFADEITKAEKEYTIFEDVIMNLVYIYGGRGKSIPPTSGLGFQAFESSGDIWIRTQVEEYIQYNLMPFMNLIQFENAQNTKEIRFISDSISEKYYPFSKGFYKSFNIITGKNSYDLNANVEYPFSDIFLQVRSPGKGPSETIKPSVFPMETSGQGATNMITGNYAPVVSDMVLKMLNVEISDYRFGYDISFPLLIKLEDPEAFKGEGYNFNFALEGNIVDNIPVNESMVFSIINQPYSLSMNDPANRIQRDIIIEAYDKHTGEPLEDVGIEYRCGFSFDMGLTEMNNNKAILETTFPFCQFGGQIVYTKPNYLGGSIDFNNDGTDLTEEHIKLELWPIKEKNVKIYKRTVSDVYNLTHTGPGAITLYDIKRTEIDKDDSVMFNINRIKDDVLEDDIPYVGFLLYTTEDSSLLTGTNTVMDYKNQKNKIEKMYSDGDIDKETRDSYINSITELENEAKETEGTVLAPMETEMEFVPGAYSVDAYLLYTGLTEIPELKMACAPKCNPSAIILETCDETLGSGVDFGDDIIKELPCDTYFEAQNFSTWMNGGAKFDFSLTESQVYNDKDIVFYVLEQEVPQNWEDMMEITTLEEYQEGKEDLVSVVLE
jgi:hypothetical protein